MDAWRMRTVAKSSYQDLMETFGQIVFYQKTWQTSDIFIMAGL